MLTAVNWLSQKLSRFWKKCLAAVTRKPIDESSGTNVTRRKSRSRPQWLLTSAETRLFWNQDAFTSVSYPFPNDLGLIKNAPRPVLVAWYCCCMSPTNLSELQQLVLIIERLRQTYPKETHAYR